ncbi:MAG: group III truncated hemoglobin [Bacteroidetes bacterium]|nr:MAG: group III truncated hemoglobin [Bacteroidota bacterium]REK07535.1 MAG: group III truncated hemoglobin [Bacteroidota bacterium]REK37032.1 MAG: group III truncated hemoglobin [Bacteroidota bacterium]REK47854.1 MAG: group III truncated hemoglobin [Bacteroidota bacterium]
MRNNIQNRADIELLVNTFYEKVRNSKRLDHIFENVAHINWITHLPKMYSFWCSMLLNEHSYSGNPVKMHIELSQITPLTSLEFSEWLLLFQQTVDDLFEGEKAEEAKTRATNIAKLMLHKIETE